jgi:hypothetical protein
MRAGATKAHDEDHRIIHDGKTGKLDYARTATKRAAATRCTSQR